MNKVRRLRLCGLMAAGIGLALGSSGCTPEEAAMAAPLLSIALDCPAGTSLNSNGRCVVAPTFDRPGIQDLVGGRPQPSPWPSCFLFCPSEGR